jgi:hypothetical protein
MDAKAGVALGFAGAIVALTPRSGLLADLGRAAAVTSGLLAVWAFWPRRYWNVNLREVRDLLLPAEPVFARLRLLDTQIAQAEGMRATLHRKAWRLKGAMTTMAAATVLLTVGMWLD